MSPADGYTPVPGGAVGLVCHRCGAVVVYLTKHDEFHDHIDRTSEGP